jgi:hypothetical protein
MFHDSQQNRRGVYLGIFSGWAGSGRAKKKPETENGGLGLARLSGQKMSAQTDSSELFLVGSSGCRAGIPYSALLASVTARTLTRDPGGPAQFACMFFLMNSLVCCFLVR